jgi:DNA-binding LacI/PurR family transcriptional regulator
MGVTIKDVARKVGVTPATVSMVINNKPRISEETRSRVLAAIEELDYFPHEGARSLVLRRSNTLGLAAPFFTSYFVQETLNGFEQAVRQSDFNLVLYGTRGPVKTEDEVFTRIARERKVDGLVSVSLDLGSKQVKYFQKNGVQVVCLEYQTDGCDSVLADNTQGAYEATRHLIGLGHQRIALFNGPARFSPAREREQGFHQALAEAGLAFEPGLRFETPRYSRDEGVEAGKRIVEMGSSGPTAMFVASGDICASGLLLAFKRAGCDVPGRYSVVGFDDQPFAELVDPPLTTVRQPIAQMGAEAFTIIKEALKDPKGRRYGVKMFPTELVVRGTTGPCPR